MAKYDAFGTTLEMGVRQVETAVIVGAITGNGNATFTLTKSGMTGSPIATSVAVVAGDTPTSTATKAAAALNLVANIIAVCDVKADGINVVVTALTAAADDATFNLAYTNGTCTGLTPDATSTNTIAGEALATIAQVTNFGGPSLALDTEDVTTHDSTGAWEEVIATVLRTSELTLDIVYDPVDNTHDYTGGLGLVDKLDNKELGRFVITFPDAASTKWYFSAYVTGFEPGAPHDGALTASVSLKIDGAPTLA